MTQTDIYRTPSGLGSLEAAVASITGPVARRLTARYVPIYAAMAVMLLVAAVAPSRVDKGNQASAGASLTLSELATSGGGTSVDERAGGGPPTSSNAFPVVTAPADNMSSMSLPEPAAVPDPVGPPNPDGAASGGFPEGDPGGFSDDGHGEQGRDDDGGFTGGESPCPVEFGEDPEVSRGVAGVLLSAASPALSLAGPFGPNAVPALGLASPVLPVIAPVADKFSPYIRMMNPLFLQVSQLGTTLWGGPLQPLEGPLLQLNGAVIQPLEVELLAASAGPIEQLNATPLTPCLQRLVYNLVAPLPTPTP